MEGRAIAVMVVAGVLGVTAIVLGFVGEVTRIKVDEVEYSTVDGYCYYPESPATALGITASILLLIEQIVISVGASCFCCRRPPCPSACGGICALICFIFSWLVFVGAFPMLITASVLNNVSYLIRNYSTEDNLCPVAKPGFFVWAAILCVFSVSLSFISYIIMMNSNNKKVAQKSTEHGVAMAQPQLPNQQV